ncbi:MAG: hypothetical protein AB7U29_03430 [Desulfobulbus sp.]
MTTIDLDAWSLGALQDFFSILVLAESQGITDLQALAHVVQAGIHSKQAEKSKMKRADSTNKGLFPPADRWEKKKIQSHCPSCGENNLVLVSNKDDVITACTSCRWSMYGVLNG